MAQTPAGNRTEPGTFRNDYFGFSFSFPTTWKVVTQTSRNQFQAAGGDLLVSEGVLKPEVVKADQSNTTSLIKIEKPPADLLGFSPHIVVIGEGIHEGAPFDSAKGYLAHTAKLFPKTGPIKFFVIEPGKPVTLGGKQFYRAEFKTESPGGTTRQFFYTRFEKSFAFSIVVCARDANRLATADGLLTGVRFDDEK